MATRTPKLLKHYTSIKNLFKILDSKSLLLGDTKKWKDKNDTAAVRAFCRLKGERIQARVLCFAEGEEVIHHWNTYAKNGCFIEFNENEILKEITGPDFLHGFVKYKHNKEITKAYLNRQKTNALPFLKRSPYKCEKEYRLIWFGKANKPASIPLKSNTIKRITLSPQIPDIKRKELQSEIEKKLENQFGKNGIEVELSRLLKLDKWISKFDHLGKATPAIAKPKRLSKAGKRRLKRPRHRPSNYK